MKKILFTGWATSNQGDERACTAFLDPDGDLHLYLEYKGDRRVFSIFSAHDGNSAKYLSVALDDGSVYNLASVRNLSTKGITHFSGVNFEKIELLLDRWNRIVNQSSTSRGLLLERKA